MTTAPIMTVCRLTIYLTLSIFLAACSLIQLNEETQILRESTILVGNVACNSPSWDSPILVAAYTKDKNKRKVVHFTAIHEPGPYELIVPQGHYYIAAFGDKNQNLRYDKGEPAGQYWGAQPLSVSAGGVVSDIDMLISSHQTGPIDLPVGTTMARRKNKTIHFTSPGAIANLDDVLFSDEYGKKGFWSPLQFFKEVGGNVYFLEAYNPEKIPILFIHGAAGSPQNWKPFFESLDSKKYQPWFFYYPSGASLDSMSHLLFWKLLNLQTKYKFKELYITAHSMGGLVARSFIVKYGENFPSITHFISISTPWGGEDLAEAGVKYSPAVIPAWRDMQPNGEFIESIFSKKIPPSIEFFLFFGHQGNRNPFRPNNDKVVTLSSQLDQRSQRDAKMIYGFNEDHVSILSAEQVLHQYSAILAASNEQKLDADKVPGNRLRLNFSFDSPENHPRPRTIFLLRSVDIEGSGTWFYLNPEDTGQEYGPFPPGRYEVSLMALAFEPEPSKIPVTIEEGSVPSIEFSMKPRGSLSGYVVQQNNGTHQAGESLQPDTGIEIQTITLSGGGITRTLIPTKEDINFSEYYLSGTDYASKGSFYFYGLSAGEYKLTVKAKGYKQYSKVHKVRPGQNQGVITIELLE